MGAMLTIKEIDDSVMVVIGPDECAYYTQMATSGGSMKANGCKIVSVVLDQHDVTFGCQEKMDEAFSELMEEFASKAVCWVKKCRQRLQKSAMACKRKLLTPESILKERLI